MSPAFFNLSLAAQHRARRLRRGSAPRAYTLIEVLVVAVVIVLMLGMALPVFHAITGSRSEAGASNLIAATLGRARTDAIGLQKPIGVAFAYNASTQITYMAEVSFPDCPAWTNGLIVPPLGYTSFTYVGANGSSTYYYINKGNSNFKLGTPPAAPGLPDPTSFAAVGGPPLEIAPDTELLALPTGIGVQTICNSTVNGSGVRVTDGYLNFGVILFDGHGRITTQNYGISQHSKLLNTAIGPVGPDYPDPSAGITNPYSAADPYLFGVPSQYGLVVFQREAFVSQNFPANDPAYTAGNSGQQSAYTSSSPSQQAEENWLDQNSTPLLLDRYTGTLIKAE